MITVVGGSARDCAPGQFKSRLGGLDVYAAEDASASADADFERWLESLGVKDRNADEAEFNRLVKSLEESQALDGGDLEMLGAENASTVGAYVEFSVEPSGKVTAALRKVPTPVAVGVFAGLVGVLALIAKALLDGKRR